MGGGSEVLVVAYGYDSYNQALHKELTHSLKTGGGGDDLPRVLIMTYQNKTGALTSGAHPGSYNGQDAYNDMLITQERNGNVLDGRRGQFNADGTERGGGATDA